MLAGLIGIRVQEWILEQPLFRQGCDGRVHFTLQHPSVGDGCLLRLLEPMQLDVTQEQRHHRPSAKDQAWVVLV